MSFVISTLSKFSNVVVCGNLCSVSIPREKSPAVIRQIFAMGGRRLTGTSAFQKFDVCGTKVVVKFL